MSLIRMKMMICLQKMMGSWVVVAEEVLRARLQEQVARAVVDRMLELMALENADRTGLQ